MGGMIFSLLLKLALIVAILASAAATAAEVPTVLPVFCWLLVGLSGVLVVMDELRRQRG